MYFCLMNTIKIDILNPKATKLLKNLADLQLIAIQKPAKNNFITVLENLRSKAKSAPSLEEITKEVEMVRTKLYGK